MRESTVPVGKYRAHFQAQNKYSLQYPSYTTVVASSGIYQSAQMGKACRQNGNDGHVSYFLEAFCSTPLTTEAIGSISAPSSVLGYASDFALRPYTPPHTGYAQSIST